MTESCRRYDDVFQNVSQLVIEMKVSIYYIDELAHLPKKEGSSSSAGFNGDPFKMDISKTL